MSQGCCKGDLRMFRVVKKVFQGCFSAAMSSSRSDKVTKFVRLSVCLSVVILSNLEHSKHLKQDV